MEYDRLVFGSLTYALLFAAGIHYDMPSVVLRAITAAAFAAVVGALAEIGADKKPIIDVVMVALAMLTYILPTIATIYLLFRLLLV